MSYVTNIILATAIDEKGVAQLNSLLRDRGFNGWFVQVDGYCGGTKAFEADVFLSAFNYLDTTKFINLLDEVLWEFPDQVQFFVQDQEEDIFTQMDVQGVIK